MTISPDDRQRVLEMLDQRPPDEDDGDESIQLLRDIKAIVPDALWEDVQGILEEHNERLDDRAERAALEADQLEFALTVAQRDPDLTNNEPMFDAIRRLAGRGDTDAMRILAEWESALSRAVGHITGAALDGASDWVRDGDVHHSTKGGRSYSAVLEDFLGQADFDALALLPDDMKAGVDPMKLMLDLNAEIRGAKELNG